MAVEYKRLFHRLIDARMSNAELAKQAKISLNIMTRLKRNEYISMESIEKICCVLDCSIDDVMEFVPSKEHSKKRGR